MKKILVIFIAFSVTLYGCIFDIGFDKDQYRVSVPVLISNLKDTLNIGDTLIFSAAIDNPVEVVDISKERKKTFNNTFPENTDLEIIPSLYGPLEANATYPNVIKSEELDATYSFFTNEGIIRVLPYPIIKFNYVNNKFVFNFGIVVKKRGLYGIYLQKEYININDNKQPFSGHLYSYFKSQNLNHHLLNENQKKLLSTQYHGDKVIVFYVK